MIECALLKQTIQYILKSRIQAYEKYLEPNVDN